MTGFQSLNTARRIHQRQRIEKTAELLSEDLPIKEIALRLGVSTRTIDDDLAVIRKGLGAQAV